MQRIRSLLLVLLISISTLTGLAPPAQAYSSYCRSASNHHTWGNSTYPPFQAETTISYCYRMTSPYPLASWQIYNIRGLMSTDSTTLYQTAEARVPTYVNKIAILPADTFNNVQTYLHVYGYFRVRSCLLGSLSWSCTKWVWKELEMHLHPYINSTYTRWVTFQWHGTTTAGLGPMTAGR